MRKLSLETQDFRRVLAGSALVSIERIFKLVCGFLIGVWMARHFGPEQYGVWSYALAFCVIFETLASVGLEAVVVRELVRRPADAERILGTTIAIKLTGACLSAGMAVIIVGWFPVGREQAAMIIQVVALSFLVNSLRTIELYFQAIGNNARIVIARVTGLLMATVMRITLLLSDAGLLWFAVAVLAECSWVVLVLGFFYRKTHISGQRWRFDRIIAVELGRAAWPYVFSDLAVVVYMRFSMLALGDLSGAASAGIYAVALAVTEATYFLPMSIHAVVLPRLLKIPVSAGKVSGNAVQHYFNLMCLLGVVIALLLSTLGVVLIPWVFGEHYGPSQTVLAILAWSAVATCLGIASSGLIVAEQLQAYAFYRTILGALVNVLMLYYLVPEHSANGAAAAALTAYMAATYSVFAFPRTRHIGAMLWRASLPSNWLGSVCWAFNLLKKP